MRYAPPDGQRCALVTTVRYGASDPHSGHGPRGLSHRLRGQRFDHELAPAIRRASLELCSAPCKPLRSAPTPHCHPNAAAALGAPAGRGLRGLTAPARSSPNGSYLMAGHVAGATVTLPGLTRDSMRRYSAGISPVPHGTPSAWRTAHAERVLGRRSQGTIARFLQTRSSDVHLGAGRIKDWSSEPKHGQLSATLRLKDQRS